MNGKIISSESSPKTANAKILWPKLRLASKKDNSMKIPDIFSITSVQTHSAMPCNQQKISPCGANFWDFLSPQTLSRVGTTAARRAWGFAPRPPGLRRFRFCSTRRYRPTPLLHRRSPLRWQLCTFLLYLCTSLCQSFHRQNLQDTCHQQIVCYNNIFV